MIKERERMHKENQEKARKQQEEQRLREERNNKKLQSENARATAQKAKRILTNQKTTANSSTANQQASTGEFAMIRTLGGQTYKIPTTALAGKKAGDEVIIKTGNPASGQFTNTTRATIISIYTPNKTTNAPSSNKTATTTVSSTTTAASNTIVKPLVISGGTTTNLATGISASSLQQQQSITHSQTSSTSIQSGQPQKIQLIRQQISNPVVNQQQTTTPTTNAATTTTSSPTTIRLVSNASFNQANNQTQVQIPIKLPDGRMQIIQLPASMLNSSTPIQIAIPQKSASGTTTASTTTIIRTVPAQQQNNSSPQIRTITPNQLSSNSSTSASPVIRTIQSTSNPIIRTITPVPSNSVSQPIIRTISSAPNNIIQQIKAATQPVVAQPAQKPIEQEKPIQIVKSTAPATVTTPSKAAKNSKQQSTTNSKSTPKLEQSKNLTTTTTNQLSLSQSKPLLQHQLFDDQLNQSDNLLKVEESSFKLTPQVKQEMVKAALSSKTNTPEIQQKLLALQKHTQLQAGGSLIKEPNQSTSIRRSTAGGLTRGNLTRHSNQLQSIRSSLSSLSSSKGLEEERDDIVVKTIIKAMIDKIEKDEKLEIKRKKARENQLQAKWRQMNMKQNLKLVKNSELIKKEMLKRRALYQKNCKEIIDREIRSVQVKLNINVHDLKSLKSLNDEGSSTRKTSENSDCENSDLKPFNELVNVKEKKEDEQTNRSMLKNLKEEAAEEEEEEIYVNSKIAEMAPVNNSMVRDFNSGDIGAGHKRKSITSSLSSYNNITKNLNKFRSDLNCKANSAAKFKRRSNTTDRFKRKAFNSQRSDIKKRKFKHPKLISNNLSENQFNDQFFDEDEMETQVDQQTGQVIKQKRLYCICRQPYDSKRFMVGCDICHNWFHCGKF